MLQSLARVFAPGGSGGFLRRMAGASMRTVKELDAQVFEKSPPSFDVANLGDQIIVSIDEDGQILHAKSAQATPGREYQWSGPCNPKANLFKVLTFVGDDLLDRQKFLDYVYNYHHVLIDLKKQTIVIIDDNVADELTSRDTTAARYGLYRSALGSN